MACSANAVPSRVAPNPATPATLPAAAKSTCRGRLGEELPCDQPRARTLPAPCHLPPMAINECTGCCDSVCIFCFDSSAIRLSSRPIRPVWRSRRRLSGHDGRGIRGTHRQSKRWQEGCMRCSGVRFLTQLDSCPLISLVRLVFRPDRNLGGRPLQVPAVQHLIHTRRRWGQPWWRSSTSGDSWPARVAVPLTHVVRELAVSCLLALLPARPATAARRAAASGR